MRSDAKATRSEPALATYTFTVTLGPAAIAGTAVAATIGGARLRRA
ncbi:MAG: hypothetical protein ACLQU9_13550 [Acidimicrobiales bacterium]